MTQRFNAFGSPASEPEPTTTTPRRRKKSPAKKKASAAPPTPGTGHNAIARTWLANLADAMLAAMDCADERDLIDRWLAQPETPDLSAKPNQLFAVWSQAKTCTPTSTDPDQEAVDQFNAAGETLTGKQQPDRIDPQKVPGKKISNYPSPHYEFTLPDGTREGIFVRHSEGMKEARAKLAETLTGKQTENPEPKTEKPPTEKPETESARMARLTRQTRETLTELERIGVLGKPQASVVRSALRGEEWEWFVDKIAEIRTTFDQIPVIYEQDGKGHDAIVHLHYFRGSADWFVTEKDPGADDDEDWGQEKGVQYQAFGFTDLGDPANAEFGYVCLPEITGAGVELDFHWTPKPLRECRGIPSPEPSPTDPEPDQPAEAVDLEPVTPVDHFLTEIAQIVDAHGHGDDLIAALSGETFTDHDYTGRRTTLNLRPTKPGNQHLPLGIVIEEQSDGRHLDIGHYTGDEPGLICDWNPCLGFVLDPADPDASWKPTAFLCEGRGWASHDPAWNEDALLTWARDTWLPILRTGFLTGKENQTTDRKTA